MSKTSPKIDPERADRFVSQVSDYLLRLPPAASAGESLGAIRHARGVTQAQLAKRLGVEQTHVSRIEQRQDLKVSTVLSYLQALDGDDVELHVTFEDGARIALHLPSSQR